MDRDSQLKSLRSILDLPSASSEMEIFQNESLRPILKLQHLVTLALIKNGASFENHTKHLDNESALTSYLKVYLQKNIALKNQILGSIVGMMTETELAFYFANRKEVNKRIISMQVNRFVDTFFEDR